MKLVFEIDKQKIVRTDKNKVVADSRNYLYADFIFKTDEWDNVTKTATFEKGSSVYNVVLDNDSCLIPWEVIKEGKLLVSVFGGDLITTDVVDVTIYESGYKEGETPKEPTPDVYQQIMNKLSNLPTGGVNKEEVETVVSEYVAANADQFKGADGKDGQNGKDGTTPQKGVDYWTASDKEEIKAYIDKELLGGAS